MRWVQQRWQRAAAGVLGAACASVVMAQPPQAEPAGKAKAAEPANKYPLPGPPPSTILGPNEAPIDLGTALRLAGVENPELLLARERVTQALAERQLAAVQLLPDLNAGTSYNSHNGVLQHADGQVITVNRQSMYYGLGASAIGSGTVNIPGLYYNFNVGTAWFGFLTARQRVRTREFDSEAVRNDVLLRACTAYLDLLNADGRRAIAARNRAEAAEVARLTAQFANAQQGRPADAKRAAVDLQRRDMEVIQADNDTLTASARLCQVLNLDPSTRLKPIEGWVVPASLVPDPTPLADLIAIALMQRPELGARRSEVRTALYELSMAKVLPFSPTVIAGMSVGGFGGGSNIVANSGIGPSFGDFAGRTDLDVAVFWTFKNLGVGNWAMVKIADSRMKQTRFQELETLNLVRTQVAEAQARANSRYLQIGVLERAVRDGATAFNEDMTRVKGGLGLPLELLYSLDILCRARYEYLDSIVGYNRAQFQLWVALGRPPANALARPIPADLVPPPQSLPNPRIDPVGSAAPDMRSTGATTSAPIAASPR